jgi:putative redox protein
LFKSGGLNAYHNNNPLFYITFVTDFKTTDYNIMKVTLSSVNGEKNYIGTNERGQTLTLSGQKEGVGPMESVLIAGAACSSIDIDLILRKMKQDFRDIKVEVEGARAEDQVPAVFVKIHLHYKILGRNLKDAKVKDAVDKSVKKYCSVLTMLEKTAEVTYSYEIAEVSE